MSAFPPRTAAGTFTAPRSWAAPPSKARSGNFPHGSATIITLASFTGTGAQGVTNGRGVYAGVTLDSSGNLFGTTTGGGVNDDGTVWEIVHGTTTLTTLASFNKTNGAHPYCRATIDSRGNLYGTAASGGTANKGVIWEIPATAPPPTPHTYILWNNTDGRPPSGIMTRRAARSRRTPTDPSPDGRPTLSRVA